MPRRYPYVLVDVFTERALEGNALAVFTDARGLSGAELQGLEVGRPSRIFVRAGLADGRPQAVRVGGHVVEVGRGELRL